MPSANAVPVIRYKATERSTTPPSNGATLKGTSITNLALQSQTLDVVSVWGLGGLKNYGSGSTANATAAPDGTVTAESVIEDTTANPHQVLGSITPAALTVYTLSVYVKPNGRHWVDMKFSAGFGVVVGAFFDVTAGVVGTTFGSSLIHTTITRAGNGWFRISITARSGAAPSGALAVFRLATGDNAEVYTGDGASGLFLWGIQLETGYDASTYIPTTTVAVTQDF